MTQRALSPRRMMCKVSYRNVGQSKHMSHKPNLHSPSSEEVMPDSQRTAVTFQKNGKFFLYRYVSLLLAHSDTQHA